MFSLAHVARGETPVVTVNRYVYASGQQTQYKLGRKFISEWLALRWERDGKAVIVTIQVGARS